MTWSSASASFRSDMSFVTVPDTMCGAVLASGHAEGVSFTKAHLLRSIVCIALASLSLESTSQVEPRTRDSLETSRGHPCYAQTMLISFPKNF